MPVHDFHAKIGDLIKKSIPDSEALHVWQDHACADEGHPIPLYSKPTDASRRVELCNVDMLIEVGGGAKVIIEIEESNVKPTHIFGKFYASAFCDLYGSKKSGYKPFGPSMLFIQILKDGNWNEKTMKRDQWECISESISAILTSSLHGREWKYKLFHGSKKDFEADGIEGKKLVTTIREFIEK